MGKTRVEKRAEGRAVARERAEQPRAEPGHQSNKSWDGQSKGSGGEGFSKGYGGSGGAGTGPSGPESKPAKRR